jgi:sulfofructose kinase
LRVPSPKHQRGIQSRLGWRFGLVLPMSWDALPDMNTPLDILGLGCVAVDDLLYVSAYPPADAKVPIRRRERQCGGLTATALVAAARLGAQCAYAGVLGTEELSQFALDRLQQEHVDVTHVRRRPKAQPIHSFVIVDENRQTRTILYDLESVFGPEPGWPDAAVIRSARVLFVDHFGVEAMIWAAQMARAAGGAVVADFERDEMPQFPQLLELVDHLILSRDFAAKRTGETQASRAAEKLWTSQRQAVVITCGAEGCWYRGTGLDGSQHLPAFPVPVVDTTGCGDVFHGAYAAALVRGLDLHERVRFAAAAAALKATQRGGQAGIPSRAAVEAFLKERSR